jgi:hypothetical protein
MLKKHPVDVGSFNVMPCVDVVRGLYSSCVHDDGDVVYEGITTHRFQRAALVAHKDAIAAQVNTLDKSINTCIPWLNTCMDSAGAQWGDQADMEMLVSVGVACGALVELYKADRINRVFSLPSSPFNAEGPDPAV